MASLTQILTQAPQVGTLGEFQAEFCAANPGHRDCRGSSFLGQFFEVVQPEVIQAVFPLFSVPGLLPSGLESAGREFSSAVGLPQETVPAIKQASNFLISSGAINFLSPETVGGFAMSDWDFSTIFEGFDFGSLGQSLVTEVGLPVLRQELIGTPPMMPQAINVAAPSSQALQSIRGSIAPALTGAMAGAGMLAAKQAVQAILQKIAINTGLRSVPSLNRIVMFAKKAIPWIGQAAVAAGLAITVEELSTLIFHQATKKRRRMNAGNAHALRRSMRRIESFHKLCQRADMLKSRGCRTRKKCGSGSTQFVRQG